ncbi:MAG: aminodeoxychorismate lyase [Candidatus Parcubacteria bacterium]|nr:MAG: aminodeoxychorismate lyase [Candidatus Parcubacteria bacterium]
MATEALINKIFRLYPIIFLLFILSFIFIHFIYSVFAPVFIGDIKTVIVPNNIKVVTLGHQLEKDGIIRSSFYFRFVIFLKKSTIRAGIYEFHGSYNLIDVVNLLEKGGKGIKITITEGMTLREIQSLFSKNNFKVNFAKYTLNDFSQTKITDYFPATATLEGFLMPDSYEFLPSDNEKKIITAILNNFMKKAFPVLLKGNDFSLYERLILASIVEKEAKIKEDFAPIAGILIKRLKNNYKLEADAPIVYEKCQYTFCTATLSKEDLLKDSDFNTRKKTGLTPQPISNPGLIAIEAVNQPLISDYFFYLTTKDGKAIFSKSYAEHKKNIEKYLK